MLASSMRWLRKEGDQVWSELTRLDVQKAGAGRMRQAASGGHNQGSRVDGFGRGKNVTERKEDCIVEDNIGEGGKSP